MKKVDSEARLMRLKDSLAQVRDSIFKINPASTYVRHLLMQEQQELKMEIANLTEYRRVRGWS